MMENEQVFQSYTRVPSRSEWIIRVLAPYGAVLVGLLVMESAWLAIVLYHAQIVAWNWRSWGASIGCWDPRQALVLALPCVFTGPVVFFVLPYLIVGPDNLDAWLISHGLGGTRFVFFAIYFGIVHPILEQIHWDAARADRRWGRVSHFAFAGYHALVLYPLLNVGGLLLSLIVLVLASMSWRHLSISKGGLLLPVLTHTLAELGIIAAVVIYAMV